MEYIQYKTHKISVEYRKQNRRNIMIRTRTGGVIVYMPRWLKPNHPEVKKALQASLPKLIDYIPEDRPTITEQDELRHITYQWAGKMNVSPKRITFRDMQQKWGSCSSLGNITLANALCTIPFELAEYVIVHELAHLIHLDHSPAFWKCLEQYIPDYRQRKKQLEEFMT